VHAEDLPLYNGCKGQIVECVIEIVPYVVVAVFLGDLVVEAVDVGDVAGLVVAAEEDDHFGVFDLVEEEQ
jgi:hypothetical protein